MPFETNGLTSQVFAQIFGTLALRTNAVAAFAFGAEIAVEKYESAGAGTLLLTEDVRSALRWDFPEATIISFLGSLAAGRLNNFRYDLRQGNLRTTDSSVAISQEELVRLQDPVDPALKRPASKTVKGDVRLTVPGVFLENIERIPTAAFEEAAFRALGLKNPEFMDLLWLHAGHGELRRYDVTESVVLSAAPPEVDKDTYRKAPTRFPLVCLQFDHSSWKTDARHVIGRDAERNRLMAVLEKTSWNLHIQGRPAAHRNRVRETLVALIRSSAPPPPPQETAAPSVAPVTPAIPKLPKLPKLSAAPKRGRPRREPPAPPPPPAAERPSFVAEVFFRPDAELARKGRPGIVGITEPGIRVEDLAQVPRHYFETAVRWSLGVREPREGDQIFFTAGEQFSKNGEIRGCVFVCPEIPDSRKSSTYPKIRIEYHSGRWVVLRRSLSGQGVSDLLNAVTTIADWGVGVETEE